MEEKTYTNGKVTLTWCNTMMGEVRHELMEAKFADEKHPDQKKRWFFCYIMSHAVKVDGIEAVNETSSPEEFEMAYHAYASSVEPGEWWDAIKALNDLKATKANNIERHDSTLTDEEKNDPNS